MLRTELGWTVAKPPDTTKPRILFSIRFLVSCGWHGILSRTEELLAAAALLNNLDQARLQLLDGGNVVGQDTHLSGLGGEVDLDDILGLEDRLFGADN